AHEADAVMVDGGLVYEAGLRPYNLKPVVAEFYGSKDGASPVGTRVSVLTQLLWGEARTLSVLYLQRTNPQTHHYAVAVVKKGSNFQLNQLQGKKSCHTGLGWSAGWNIPMRILLPSDWSQEAVAKFFAGSCVPCADQSNFPQLCQLCAGKGMDKCACSHHEPYFGYSGAFKCLQDGVGDVSFVRHLTVFGFPPLENLANQADRDQYELLCRENTRMPVDAYKECHLARVPSHAVVARSVDGKEDLIWELLNQAQWSALSGGILKCTTEESAEDCIAAIAKGEADAMSLDGGFIYTAGKCGLVPVLAENYCKWRGGEGLGGTEIASWYLLQGYYVVAVVKKSDADLTWSSLRGKKSCHTAVGTSAGWNIPMGFIYNQTGSCKFDEFFSESCAPGSDPESSLCALCGGSFKPAHMCAPNSHEQYYGSSGALRQVASAHCLWLWHQTIESLVLSPFSAPHHLSAAFRRGQDWRTGTADSQGP
ncbi:hypothetical protein Celaphus_00012932, partial [Cervus elaphus hippelaphus]